MITWGLIFFGQGPSMMKGPYRASNSNHLVVTFDVTASFYASWFKNETPVIFSNNKPNLLSVISDTKYCRISLHLPNNICSFARFAQNRQLAEDFSVAVIVSRQYDVRHKNRKFNIINSQKTQLSPSRN